MCVHNSRQSRLYAALQWMVFLLSLFAFLCTHLSQIMVSNNNLHVCMCVVGVYRIEIHCMYINAKFVIARMWNWGPFNGWSRLWWTTDCRILYFPSAHIYYHFNALMRYFYVCRVSLSQSPAYYQFDTHSLTDTPVIASNTNPIIWSSIINLLRSVPFPLHFSSG